MTHRARRSTPRELCYSMRGSFYLTSSVCKFQSQLARRIIPTRLKSTINCTFYLTANKTEHTIRKQHLICSPETKERTKARNTSRKYSLGSQCAMLILPLASLFAWQAFCYQYNLLISGYRLGYLQLIVVLALGYSSATTEVRGSF